jgi:heme-degrading monooxygenase HmoA
MELGARGVPIASYAQLKRPAERPPASGLWPLTTIKGMALITGPFDKDQSMFLEIAQIDIKPGMEAEFEAGVGNAAPLFQRAKGCRSFSLQRGIENPSRYRLLIAWDTVENHTKDFYGSADWQQWRKLVAHYFAAPPEAEHVREVLKGF